MQSNYLVLDYEINKINRDAMEVTSVLHVAKQSRLLSLLFLLSIELICLLTRSNSTNRSNSTPTLRTRNKVLPTRAHCKIELSLF